MNIDGKEMTTIKEICEEFNYPSQQPTNSKTCKVGSSKYASQIRNIIRGNPDIKVKMIGKVMYIETIHLDYIKEQFNVYLLQRKLIPTTIKLPYEIKTTTLAQSILISKDVKTYISIDGSKPIYITETTLIKII